MKIALISESKIDRISNILTECDSLYEQLKYRELEECEFEEYEVLNRFPHENAEEFLRELMRNIQNSSYSHMIMTLRVLLDNCVDKSLDFLDFKKELKAGKAGLELLAKMKNQMDEGHIHNVNCNKLIYDEITAILNASTL